MRPQELERECKNEIMPGIKGKKTGKLSNGIGSNGKLSELGFISDESGITMDRCCKSIYFDIIESDQ